MRPRLQILQRHVGELAVLVEPGRPEVDVPVLGAVGKALFHEGGDQVDDVLDVLGGLGMDGGTLDVEPSASVQYSAMYRSAISVEETPSLFALLMILSRRR